MEGEAVRYTKTDLSIIMGGLLLVLAVLLSLLLPHETITPLEHLLLFFSLWIGLYLATAHILNPMGKEKKP